MIKNQIVPEIEVHERITHEQRQKRNFAFKAGTKLRANNRKSNRSRKTQVIKYLVGGVFPPIFKTKEIKTFV